MCYTPLFFSKDMLDFAITAQESEVKDDKFIKNSLKFFSKGSSQNIKTILDFSKLSSSYLKKFMEMINKYEICELHGQKPVSLRHIRSKGSRLEIQLSFLKSHLSVSAKSRDLLLADLLESKISFPCYKEKIIEKANCCKTKSMVSNQVISSTPIKKDLMIKPCDASSIESPAIGNNENVHSNIQADNNNEENDSTINDKAGREILKRKVIDNVLLESQNKKPKLLNKDAFEISESIICSPGSIVVAELSGNLDASDTGERVMSALGESFRKGPITDTIGVFFR